MSIKQLNAFTIKKLTTAQVITCIYSAVKELVENALDSGANNIEVILLQKGLELIEVRDNGSGISEVDAPFMALQAYTSKLSDFSDLDTLQSYGFRGEALSALSRVSQVKITTRTSADDKARCYTLDINGNIIHAVYSHRSIGTTVRAELLFKNYPVRRQYISSAKNVNQDVKSIELLLKDYSVCRPEARFNYIIDNQTVFTKSSKDTWKESLTEIYGSNFMSNYEVLNFNENVVHIELAIPKKDLLDLSSISQQTYAHIFINSRPVVFKEFKDLILNLFSQHFGSKITSSRKKLVFFLSIKLPPSEVDINLQPNKNQVLLKDKEHMLTLVQKLIVDCYGIHDETKDAENTSIIESPAYFDSTFNDSETEDETSVNKRKKITNENGTPMVKRRRSEIQESNKENFGCNVSGLENDNTNNNNTDKDNTKINPSQLFEVELGEDFSTQEVRDIPVLSADEVNKITNTIMSNKFNVDIPDNSDKNDSEAPNLDDKRISDALKTILEDKVSPENIKNEKNSNSSVNITESQWSKGHCPILQGGANVEIVVPTKQAKKTKNSSNKTPTKPNSVNTDSVGFSKFCQITRERILEKSPHMNPVAVAEQISKEWKHLDSEERQHFRELSNRDKSMLNSSSKDINKGSRKNFLSPHYRENNKLRLLKLLENAKNYKPKTNENTKLSTDNITFDINMQKVRTSCFKKSQHKHCDRRVNNTRVIGKLKDDMWIVNLNMQIWLLNLDQLLDGLNLTETERENCKDNAEVIDMYLNRWLNEKNDMKLLHQIHNLNHQ